MVKIVSSEAESSDTGYRVSQLGDMLASVFLYGKQGLDFLDENDIKLRLQVRNATAAEVEVTDDGTTVSLNIIDPEVLGSLYRRLLSSRSD